MLQGFSDGTKLSGRFTSEFWQYVWEIQLLLPIFLWEDLQISERLWKEYPAGSKAGNDSWAASTSLFSVLPYCISLCQHGSQLYSFLFWLHEDVNEQISHYMAQLGWKQMLLVCFFADVACVLFCVGHDLQRVICESLFSPETPNIWTHSRKWFHLNFRQCKNVSQLLAFRVTKVTKESVKLWRTTDFTAIATVKTLKKQMIACLLWSVVLRFEHFYPCQLKEVLFSSVC